MLKECVTNTLILLPEIILDIKGMGAYLGHIFRKNKAFCLIAPPKQISFLTIPDKIVP